MKKKLKSIIIVLLIPVLCSGQNNIIKTNLFGLAVKNYNITYERGLSRFFSFSLGLRHMPQTSVPFKNQIENFIDNSDLKINDVRMGNTAITGEGRFYIGLKKLSGFYFAPYIRYTSFNLSMPIKNPKLNEAPIIFNGKINATSAGLLLGVQHCFLKKFVLDFWIIGGHFGKSNGILNATNIPAMTEQEQQVLQSELDEFKNIGPFKTTSKITSATSAEIKSTGPWLGLRSLALSIGYRF